MTEVEAGEVGMMMNSVKLVPPKGKCKGRQLSKAARAYNVAAGCTTLVQRGNHVLITSLLLADAFD